MKKVMYEKLPLFCMVLCVQLYGSETPKKAIPCAVEILEESDTVFLCSSLSRPIEQNNGTNQFSNNSLVAQLLAKQAALLEYVKILEKKEEKRAVLTSKLGDMLEIIDTADDSLMEVVGERLIKVIEDSLVAFENTRIITADSFTKVIQNKIQKNINSLKQTVHAMSGNIDSGLSVSINNLNIEELIKDQEVLNKANSIYKKLHASPLVQAVFTLNAMKRQFITQENTNYLDPITVIVQAKEMEEFSDSFKKDMNLALFFKKQKLDYTRESGVSLNLAISRLLFNYRNISLTDPLILIIKGAILAGAFLNHQEKVSAQEENNSTK